MGQWGNNAFLLLIILASQVVLPAVCLLVPHLNGRRSAAGIR
jgi:hypothetical protein